MSDFIPWLSAEERKYIPPAEDPENTPPKSTKKHSRKQNLPTRTGSIVHGAAVADPDGNKGERTLRFRRHDRAGGRTVRDRRR